MVEHFCIPQIPRETRRIQVGLLKPDILHVYKSFMGHAPRLHRRWRPLGHTRKAVASAYPLNSAGTGRMVS